MISTLYIHFNRQNLMNASSKEPNLKSKELLDKGIIRMRIDHSTTVEAVNRVIVETFGIDLDQYTLSLATESNRCCSEIRSLCGCARRTILEEDISPIVEKVGKTQKLVLQIDPKPKRDKVN